MTLIMNENVVIFVCRKKKLSLFKFSFCCMERLINLGHLKMDGYEFDLNYLDRKNRDLLIVYGPLMYTN